MEDLNQFRQDNLKRLLNSLGSCLIIDGEKEITFYKKDKSITFQKEPTGICSDERLKEIVSFLD